MLLASHTDHAPWIIIRSDNKKKARLNCFRYVLSQVHYPHKIDSKHLQLSPKILLGGDEELKLMESSMSLKRNDEFNEKG
jgi:hypothetical protein